jgi:hypothetical protein
VIEAASGRAVRTRALADLSLFLLALAAFIGLAFLFRQRVILSLPVVLAGAAVQAVVLLLVATALLRWRGERWAQLGLARPPSWRRTAALVGATSLAAQVGADRTLAREIMATTREELMKCRPGKP